MVTVALTHALSAVTGKKATTVAILKNDGFSFGFRAPSAGTLTIKWFATATGKKTRIGSVSDRIGASGEVAIQVKLDNAGTKLLRSTGKWIKISRSGSFTPRSGKRTKVNETITLKHWQAGALH